MRKILLFLSVLSIVQYGYASNQDCFYQPFVSECMKEQVYRPLSEMSQGGKISLKDKEYFFKLSAVTYATYLLNNDPYLYNCCGNIGEVLKKSAFSIRMSGPKISNILAELGKEVRGLVVVYGINEGDLFKKCENMVEEVLSKK